MSQIPTSPTHSFARAPHSNIGKLLSMTGAVTVRQFVELLDSAKLDKEAHVGQGVPLLHFLSGHGQLELLCELLKRNVSLSAAGGGLTPLHFAVSRDRSQCAEGEDQRRAEIIRILAKAGVPVNAQEQRGWTALKFAVRFRLLACAKQLLQLGADPDLADVEGFACLHNAAGSVELSKVLVPYVRSLDATNNRGQTPLMVSLIQSDFSTALLLIERGANTNTVDAEGNIPLTLATRLGNGQVCQHLHAKGADIHAVSPATGRQAIHYAAERGSEDLAIWMTRLGADVFAKDARGFSALQLANSTLAKTLTEIIAPTVVLDGNLAQLKELIRFGIDINAYSGKSEAPLLHRAAYYGHFDIVNYLLENGASVDIVDGEGDSPVHYACMKEIPERNHTFVLNALLTRGANPNLQNSRGDTPLHLAARWAFNQRVTTLLQKGADPKKPNTRGELPLHRACGMNDALVSVCMLLEVDPLSMINMKSATGATPLMYAVKGGALEIVQFLLESNADVNATTPRLFTALHFACQLKSEPLRSEMCRALVEKGANVNAGTGEHLFTPLHYACRHKLEDLCLLFVKYGGDVLQKDKEGEPALALLPEGSDELRNKLRPLPKPRSHNRSSSRVDVPTTPTSDSGSFSRQTSSGSVESLEMPNAQPRAPVSPSPRRTVNPRSVASPTSNTPTGSVRGPQADGPSMPEEGNPFGAQPSSNGRDQTEQTYNSGVDDTAPTQTAGEGGGLQPPVVQPRSGMLDYGGITEDLYGGDPEKPALDASLLTRTRSKPDSEQGSLPATMAVDNSEPDVTMGPVSMEMYCIQSTCLPRLSSLGSGAYSDVYKSEYKGEPVAVKLFKNLSMDEVVEVFDKEVRLLSQLSHPNVLRFIGYCTEPGFYAIITDVMERGSLFDILHDRNIDLPWTRRLGMMVDGAKGMQYLHSKSMLHRDLKSMNLLVKEDYTVKVADFGLTKVRMHTQTMASSLKGTPAYMAPELLDSKPISEATDVYAFGIILYEVATRKRPYNEHTVNPIQLMMMVLRGTRPSLAPSADIPDGYVQLAEKCWHSDFQSRPSFSDVVDWLLALHAMCEDLQ